PRSFVDSTGDEFLARPRFTRDENGRIGRRHGLGFFEYTAQSRAATHDLHETAFAAQLVFTVRFLCDRLSLELCHLPAATYRLPDGIEEVFVTERLRQEFDSAGFHGAHGHGDIAVPGDENDGQLHAKLGQLLLQIKTTEARELDIEYQAAGSIRTRAG